MHKKQNKIKDFVKNTSIKIGVPAIALINMFSPLKAQAQIAPEETKKSPIELSGGASLMSQYLYKGAAYNDKPTVAFNSNLHFGGDRVFADISSTYAVDMIPQKDVHPTVIFSNAATLTALLGEKTAASAGFYHTIVPPGRYGDITEANAAYLILNRGLGDVNLELAFEKGLKNIGGLLSSATVSKPFTIGDSEIDAAISLYRADDYFGSNYTSIGAQVAKEIVSGRAGGMVLSAQAQKALHADATGNSNAISATLRAYLN